MSAAHVLRFHEIAAIDRGNGVTARVLVSKTLGSRHLTNGITSFEPGASLPLHTHNCDESVCVIEGEAICEVDGQFFPMRPYDTTFVPEGIPHRFLNESSQRMSILWTYTSDHVTRTFMETGQTADQFPDLEGVR